MSHFSRVKTRMVEADYITQALNDLGYEWERGEVQIPRFRRRSPKSRYPCKNGCAER